jgi:hypothetical protein
MLQRFRQKRVQKDKEYVAKSAQFQFTGINLDESPIKIQENELSRSLNVFIKEGRWRKRPGLIPFGNGLPLPNPVMQIEQFFRYDGTEYLVALTTRDAYWYNVVTQFWDLISENLLVDDCELTWTANQNASAIIDTSWFRYGSKSAKISTQAGFTTGIAATKNLVSPINLSGYTHIHLYIKSSIDLNAGDLQILFNGQSVGGVAFDNINTPDLTTDASSDMEKASVPIDVRDITAGDLANLNILPTLPSSVSGNIDTQPLTVDIPLDMECAIAVSGKDINPITAQDLAVLNILPDLTGLPDVNIPRLTIFATDMPIDLEKDIAKSCKDLSLLTVSDLKNLQIMPNEPIGSSSETLNVPALDANVPTEIEIILSNASLDTNISSISLKVATNKGIFDVWLDDIRTIKCFTGDINNRFSCETVYDNDSNEVKFIITNGFDVPKCWNGTLHLIDLPGNPHKAKFVKQFYTWTLLLNCNVLGNDTPQRVDWCVPGNPKDWSGVESGTNTLAATTGPIVGCEILRGQLAILLERSITMMYATGSSPPFTFDENKILDVGCMSAGSIQSLGETLMFLGWDNFYTFDGFSCNPIGDKVINYFLDNLNPNGIDQMFSHMLEDYNLYLLFFPSPQSDAPDQVIVYDYSKNAFIGIWKFASDMTADGYYRSESATTIGALTMIIGDMDFKIGSRVFQSVAPYDMLGDYDGYIYRNTEMIKNDDGVPIESYMDTKSFMPNLGKYSRFVRNEFYAVGDLLETYVSNDNGKVFSLLTSTLLGTDETEPILTDPFDVTNEKAIFRLRNAEMEGFFNLDGFRYYSIDKDEEV